MFQWRLFFRFAVFLQRSWTKLTVGQTVFFLLNFLFHCVLRENLTHWRLQLLVQKCTKRKCLKNVSNPKFVTALYSLAYREQANTQRSSTSLGIENEKQKEEKFLDLTSGQNLIQVFHISYRLSLY